MTMKNDEYFMKIAILEAKKAYRIDEIPVGAVLYSIEENRIISKAYNTRDSKNIVIDHAEVKAIVKANKKNQNWRLPKTILYTTLEPCKMCKEIIKEAKVEKVIYGAKGRERETEKSIIQIDNEDIVRECEKLIKMKFHEIRKK